MATIYTQALDDLVKNRKNGDWTDAETQARLSGNYPVAYGASGPTGYLTAVPGSGGGMIQGNVPVVDGKVLYTGMENLGTIILEDSTGKKWIADNKTGALSPYSGGAVGSDTASKAKITPVENYTPPAQTYTQTAVPTGTTPKTAEEPRRATSQETTPYIQALEQAVDQAVDQNGDVAYVDPGNPLLIGGHVPSISSDPMRANPELANSLRDEMPDPAAVSAIPETSRRTESRSASARTPGAADTLLERVTGYDPFSYAREPEYRAALERVTGYDPFFYSREPDYQSALDSVLRYRDFSYDPETDPVYSAYRKTYAREGRRASEDTLGQYAAMTGGAPSTAAMTAAQQAGNYYSAQMADKIPELYQQAYQRYLQEYQRQLQALDAIDADRRFSYGMYGDDYSRRMQALDAIDADRRFDYGVYGDDFNRLMSRYGAARDQENTEYDRSRQEDETAYQRDQDTLDRVRQNMLDLYGMDQDRLNRERQDMLDSWSAQDQAWQDAQRRAQYGDYSGLRALGIDVDAWLAEQQAAQYYGGSGGSGKGGKGGGGSSGLFDLPETTSPDYLGAINNALQNGYNRDATIKTLAGQGVTPEDIINSRQMEMEDTNKGGYVPTASETISKEVSAITTQKQAIDWLTSKGLSSRDWQIPSEAAFNRGKDDPQSDYYGYSTYAQFLRDYVQYIYSEFGGK